MCVRALPLVGGIAVAASLSGCFLAVSSGVVRGIPDGAQAVAASLLEGETALYAWDGSFAQDGGVLVLLTDRRLVRHDDRGDVDVALEDIQQIVVDEDEGHIRVKTTGELLLLPLSSSTDRLAFAGHLQRAVQRRKLESAP